MIAYLDLWSLFLMRL